MISAVRISVGIVTAFYMAVACAGYAGGWAAAAAVLSLCGSSHAAAGAGLQCPARTPVGIPPPLNPTPTPLHPPGVRAALGDATPTNILSGFTPAQAPYWVTNLANCMVGASCPAVCSAGVVGGVKSPAEHLVSCTRPTRWGAPVVCAATGLVWHTRGLRLVGWPSRCCTPPSSTPPPTHPPKREVESPHSLSPSNHPTRAQVLLHMLPAYQVFSLPFLCFVEAQLEGWQRWPRRLTVRAVRARGCGA